jgi:hypothetical protein
MQGFPHLLLEFSPPTFPDEIKRRDEFFFGGEIQRKVITTN